MFEAPGKRPSRRRSRDMATSVPSAAAGQARMDGRLLHDLRSYAIEPSFRSPDPIQRRPGIEPVIQRSSPAKMPDLSGGKKKKGEVSSDSSSSSSALSLAESFIREKRKEYFDVVDHLAGEIKSSELKGGHIYSMMKSNSSLKELKFSHQPVEGAVWGSWWTAKGLGPKWSSFFPAEWTRADVDRFLVKAHKVGRVLELDGIAVSKSGETFYPLGLEEAPDPGMATYQYK